MFEGKNLYFYALQSYGLIDKAFLDQLYQD